MPDVNLWGNYYWPYWMILTSFTFLVPEAIALFTNKSNTLSDYARAQLHVGVSIQNTIHTLAWYSSLITWLVFVVFITGHIWYARFG